MPFLCGSGDARSWDLSGVRNLCDLVGMGCETEEVGGRGQEEVSKHKGEFVQEKLNFLP